MSCIKKENRNIYNLFTVYTCKGCTNFIDEDEIFIGKQVIKIYPIICHCSDDVIDEKQYYRSKRLVKMLDEIERYLLVNDDYIFIWASDGDKFVTLNIDFFDALILQGLNICIIF